VTVIHQDAKGYLWFGTWEGLSRFDGYRFISYGRSDGLGHHIINDIAEDGEGHLWIATNGGGISRMLDDPREAERSPGAAAAYAAGRRFVTFPLGDAPGLNRVNAIVFDAQGRLWCTTDRGIYRARINAALEPTFEPIVQIGEVALQMPALRDSRGRLWFGMGHEIVMVDGDRTVRFGRDEEIGRDLIRSIAQDDRGRLFVTNDRGLFRLHEYPATHVQRWTRIPLVLEPNQELRDLLPDSKRDALWIATTTGLMRLRLSTMDTPTPDEAPRLYKTTAGLSDNTLFALALDRDERLWIGTWTRGACQFQGEAFGNYGPAEGLTGDEVADLFQSRDGRVYAAEMTNGLYALDGGRGRLVAGSNVAPFNNVRNRIAQDSAGHWWVGTDTGVFLFAGPDLSLRDGRRVTPAEGLVGTVWPAPGVMRADANDGVWISSTNGIFRCHADSARHARCVLAVPPRGDDQPMLRMRIDRAGALWFAGIDTLTRMRSGGLDHLTVGGDPRATQPRAILQDSRGWMWIGLRYDGVAITQEPEAERPRFSVRSTAQGLASDAVWCATEDRAGRVYLGTGRGLTQVDPNGPNGYRTRVFTVVDGLPADGITACLTDAAGRVWLGTYGGVSRFDPALVPPTPNPSPIYVTHVQVAGEDLPLAETGVHMAPMVGLRATQNNLRIEFVGLDVSGEQRLRYEYRLEGADAQWSAPTDARMVTYANLAPGSYRFLVRTAARDMAPGSQPATFEFRIYPPIWRRWWFLSLAVGAFALAAFWLHQMRVQQVVAMERIRAQIATDLHDDVGAGLSQIAILSEVAKAEASPKTAALLGEAANLARSLRDSMSEIVWAIDPRHDRLSDLVQRMRQTAFNALEADGVRVEFRSPPMESLERVRLAPDRRRHVWLTFKEAVTNVARHAHAANVWIALELEPPGLRLTVRDDGCGFDATRRSSGRGLQNIRARADALHAQLDLRSAAGGGSQLELVVPLG
jgi:signal transduction histidine kinase/streptogramin lyase